MKNPVLLIALNGLLLTQALNAAELPLHCAPAPVATDTVQQLGDGHTLATVCAHGAVLHALELKMLALQQQAARQTVATHNDPLVTQLMALHAAKEHCLQAVQGLLPSFQNPSLRLGDAAQVLAMCPAVPSPR